MIKTRNSYPLRIAFQAVNSFYETHARATEKLQNLYGFNRYFIVRLFAEDQKRWREFKKTVWRLENLWHYSSWGGIHHTDEYLKGVLSKK